MQFQSRFLIKRRKKTFPSPPEARNSNFLRSFHQSAGGCCNKSKLQNLFSRSRTLWLRQANSFVSRLTALDYKLLPKLILCAGCRPGVVCSVDAPVEFRAELIKVNSSVNPLMTLWGTTSKGWRSNFRNLMILARWLFIRRSSIENCLNYCATPNDSLKAAPLMMFNDGNLFGNYVNHRERLCLVSASTALQQQSM